MFRKMLITHKRCNGIERLSGFKHDSAKRQKSRATAGTLTKGVTYCLTSVIISLIFDVAVEIVLMKKKRVNPKLSSHLISLFASRNFYASWH